MFLVCCEVRGQRSGGVLPSGLQQMKTRTLRPPGTWCGGRAVMFPLTAALRSADSRGQGCLLPAPDGHMGGDFQRGCTHAHTHARAQKRHDVSAARGAHAGAWTRILARKNRRVSSTRGALITAGAGFQQGGGGWTRGAFWTHFNSHLII